MTRFIKFMTGLASSYRMYIYAALMAVVVFGAGYYKGVNDQKLSAANAKADGIQEGVQTRGNTEKEVISLDDATLDTELGKWMRD